MIAGLDLFVGLFNNLALLVVFVAAYGYLFDILKDRGPMKRQVALGFAFALFAFGCMQVKIPVSEGVLVDQRNAVVILAGVFGGPLSAVFTALAAGAYRAHLGGRGVFGGLLGLALSAAAGAFLYYRRGKLDSFWKASLVSVAAAVFILPGFLPIGNLQEGFALMKAMAFPYGSAISVGLLVGGLLLANEERRQKAQVQLKASLAEKEALLSELYHRANNNMQIISSLLKLRAAPLRDEKIDSLIRSVESRIRAISLVYEKLSRSSSLSRIDGAEFIKDLVAVIEADRKVPAGRIEKEFDLERLDFIIDTAIPLGLAVNEIMTNSFQHAFPEGRSGTIRISLRREGIGIAALTLSDDGVGFPQGFDPEKGGSFGITTLLNIVRLQLRGTVKIVSGAGVAYRITIKDRLHEERI